jgi:hypothetical protein
MTANQADPRLREAVAQVLVRFMRPDTEAEKQAWANDAARWAVEKVTELLGEERVQLSAEAHVEAVRALRLARQALDHLASDDHRGGLTSLEAEALAAVERAIAATQG